MTNRARLWYVPLDINDPERVLNVPPMTYESEEAENRGVAAYKAQKADREKQMTMVHCNPPFSAFKNAMGMYI